MNFLRSRLQRLGMIEVDAVREKKLSEHCEKLLEKGATSFVFKFSKAPQDPMQIREFKKTVELCKSKGLYTFIQDDVLLTLSFGAHGTYFSQEPGNLEWAQKVLGKDRLIAFPATGKQSLESDAQVVELIEHDGQKLHTIPCCIINRNSHLVNVGNKKPVL